MKKCKVYTNGKLIGTCDDPEGFMEEMRQKRRSGEVSHEEYHSLPKTMKIIHDPGRTRRPLIVVENGGSLLTDEHVQKIADGEITWQNLINEGIIEYLDAEEEENTYIAMFADEINEYHTHLEIDPATMLGICAGIIPYANHNSSPRNTMEAGMTKQALGLYVSNYNLRTDTCTLITPTTSSYC